MTQIISFVSEESMKNSQKNNKLILKTQKRFKSESDDVLTEEINKIILNSNDYKGM